MQEVSTIRKNNSSKINDNTSLSEEKTGNFLLRDEMSLLKCFFTFHIILISLFLLGTFVVGSKFLLYFFCKPHLNLLFQQFRFDSGKVLTEPSVDTKWAQKSKKVLIEEVQCDEMDNVD